MKFRIIGETPDGAQATAAADIEETSECCLEYEFEGLSEIATFRNFKIAQTAAIRALFSGFDFNKIHVRKTYYAEPSNPSAVYEGHAQWFETLRKQATAATC